MDVILDVDTGVDDALAILLAIRSPQLRVRAITCVAGNVGVDQAVVNTLKVLDAAGAPEDLPVGRGSDSPSVAEPRGLHGRDGMADLGLPGSSRGHTGLACDVLSEAILAADVPLTMLALGPLTNVAEVLADPAHRARITRVVVVGGTGLEFNLKYDLAAAEEVERSGVPIIRYGAGAFFSTGVAPVDIERLSASPESAARLAGRLLRHQAARFGPDRATIGDAGAVALVLDPDADAPARTRLFLAAVASTQDHS